VTLLNGNILVTGGKGRERDVFLLTGEDTKIWVRRQSLRQGRRGHSSTVVMLGSEERVVVAGGWDARGRCLASVELFSEGQNNWKKLTSLPSPRGDFSLTLTQWSPQLVVIMSQINLSRCILWSQHYPGQNLRGGASGKKLRIVTEKEMAS